MCESGAIACVHVARPSAVGVARQDGDAVVLFNFRADRMVQISKCFEYENFNVFDRKRFPKVEPGLPLKGLRYIYLMSWIQGYHIVVHGSPGRL
jgi:hypothetical protein